MLSRGHRDPTGSSNYCLRVFSESGSLPINADCYDVDLCAENHGSNRCCSHMRQIIVVVNPLVKRYSKRSHKAAPFRVTDRTANLGYLGVESNGSEGKCAREGLLQQ